MKLVFLTFFFAYCCCGRIYRHSLIYIQRARWGQFAFNYRSRQEIWCLLDILFHYLPTTTPNLLLRQVIDDFNLKHEADMAKRSSLENFRKLLIVDDQLVEPRMSGDFIISHELANLTKV